MGPVIHALSVIPLLAVSAQAQAAAAQAAGILSDSQVRPPVAKADLQIVMRAPRFLMHPGNGIAPTPASAPPMPGLQSLLRPGEGNRRSKREIRASRRGDAGGAIRNRWDRANRNYEHRLMGYNNDPSTSFADLQKVLSRLEARIAKRLNEEPPANASLAEGGRRAAPSLKKADLEILRRARQILDSPAKWDRADKLECAPNAKTISLYCAPKAAAQEMSGTFDDGGAAIQEVRALIDETAPITASIGRA